MNTVLVTGVGAIIGYGIVRSARACKNPLRIIGTDIYEDAAGQKWCDEFEQAVPTADHEFPHFFTELVKRHKVDLVIPGIEQDVEWLTNHTDLIQKLPAQFVLNNPESIQLGTDKWLTHSHLTNAGFPTIKTFLEGSFEELSRQIGVPFLLKPRCSYASKGIHTIYDERDFMYWREKTIGEPLYQEIVGNIDSEYTVGLFGYGDGTCSHILAFQRILASDGSTAKAKTVNEPLLENRVRKLSELFRPLGPTNFQFRVHQGEFLLLEMNPRFSSTHSLRTAFGINDVDLSITYFLNGRIPSERKIRSGQAVRYSEDIVQFESNVDS